MQIYKIKIDRQSERAKSDRSNEPTQNESTLEYIYSHRYIYCT